MLCAFNEVTGFVGMRGEFLIGINIDAANLVYDADNGAEANFERIVDIYPEEVGNGVLAHFCAVDAGVSKLILRSGSAVELDVVIARDRNKKNFGGLWINDGDNVYVATGSVVDANAAIAAGDIYDKRLSRDVHTFDVFVFVDANLELIDYLAIFDKIIVILF